MSEFLLHRYNVAIPEVDEGDDILLLRNHDGEVRRVQVKTAIRTVSGKSTPLRGSIMAEYSLSRRQLVNPVRPELCYVLSVRHQGRWDFAVLNRQTLKDCLEQAGTRLSGKPDKLTIKVRFAPESVDVRGVDIQTWRARFDVMEREFAIEVLRWVHVARLGTLPAATRGGRPRSGAPGSGRTPPGRRAARSDPRSVR